MQKSKLQFKIKKLFIFLLSAISYQLSAKFAFAQNTGITTDIGTEIKTGIGAGFFQTEVGILLSRAINAAILIGGLACLGFFLWGALYWLTSGGEKEKYSAARDKITHAFVGFAILTTVWVIWRLFMRFFGLEQVFVK